MKKIILLVVVTLSTYSIYGQVGIENVVEISKLTDILSDDITSDGMFGGSICHIGDLNGDGYQDIAVGSAGYDNRNGGVYILFLDDNFDVLDYTIIANGQGGLPSGSLGVSLFSANNMFGGSVESLGDLDGDGITDIAVSANEGLEAEFWYDQGIGSVWILFLNSDGTVKDFSWLHSGSEAWPVTLPTSLHLDYDLKRMGDLDDDGVTELARLYSEVCP